MSKQPLPIVTFARWIELKKELEGKECIVWRSIGPFDIQFNRLPSRVHVAKLVRKQETKPPHWTNWIPLERLELSEGY